MIHYVTLGTSIALCTGDFIELPKDPKEVFGTCNTKKVTCPKCRSLIERAEEGIELSKKPKIIPLFEEKVELAAGDLKKRYAWRDVTCKGVARIVLLRNHEINEANGLKLN